MQRHFFWSLALVLAPISTLAAQRADSTPAAADSLRHRIEERFAARVKEQLGLTDDQAAKLKATAQRFGTRRREFRSRYHQLREALRAQLQPGVAANQDSVAKLTDALIELRVASAQTTRDEMREVSKYLTPVQRARFLVLRERLHERMKEAREHQEMRGRGGRDGWKGRDRQMSESHQ